MIIGQSVTNEFLFTFFMYLIISLPEKNALVGVFRIITSTDIYGTAAQKDSALTKSQNAPISCGCNRSV